MRTHLALFYVVCPWRLNTVDAKRRLVKKRLDTINYLLFYLERKFTIKFYYDI